MNIGVNSLRTEAGRNAYAAVSTERRDEKKDQIKTEEDKIRQMLDRLKEQKAEGSGSPSSSRIKSSAPDDSVGQLAAELANAETLIDVQQVNGKAMRALANLKASSAMASDKDKEKIAKQIRRMEKLMKRIQKKLKLLAKEERLENRRKQAVKKQEFQKAEELRKELQSRRKKRRRDEKNYAVKEAAQDAKESVQATVDALTGGGASMDAGSFAAGGYGEAAVPAAEGVSLDVFA